MVDLYKDKDFECPLATMLNLICYKCGDKAAVIRKHSLQLLQLISAGERAEGWSEAESENESDDENSHGIYDYPLSLDSSLQDTIQRAQNNLSSTLAAHDPKLASAFLSDCLFRLDSVDSFCQKQILTYVIPWIQKIDLNGGDNPIQIKENLENLLLLTLKYADEHPHSLQSIWAKLAEKVFVLCLQIYSIVFQHWSIGCIFVRSWSEKGNVFI